MKTIIKQFTIALLTLIFGVNAFAAPANLTAAENLQNQTVISNNTYRAGDVPQTVLDPNFRAWQPSQSVPLIPAQINDIMMTDGRVIYYNPVAVNQTPPKITAFFLAHEYGHLYGSTSNEFLADQFAARVYAQTDISVVEAAIWHFYNIQGKMCDMSHGCGWQRALNIGQTAGFSQPEIEAIIRGEF